LALALALALVAPACGEAAGQRSEDPGPALTDFVPRWMAGLMEALFGEIGSPGPAGGGTATPTGDGDIGWHIDPDG
jgi:hypothetical protein